MDLKTAIVDETYIIIRDRFQHKGKGRPKALPKQIIRNNRILVQLSYLREEGNHPWPVVLGKWIPDIFPDTMEMNGSTARFSYLIEKVRQSYMDTALEPGSLEDFLNKDVDFNFISDSCASVGINRTNFSTPPLKIFDPPVKIINQVVIDLEQFRISQSLCKKYVILWINALTGLNKDKLSYVIMSRYKHYTCLNKNSKINPAALKEYVESEFSLTALKSVSLTELNSSTSTKPDVTNSKCSNFKCKKCDQLQVENANLSAALLAINKEKSLLEIKILEYENEIQQHKSELEKQHCRHVLNCKKSQINLKMKLAKASEDLINQTTVFKKSQAKNNALFNKLCKLKLDLQLKDTDRLLEQRKGGRVLDREFSLKTVQNIYSDDTRKAIIALMCDGKVAAMNVSTVIDIVSKYIFHHVFKDFPSTQTCINMLNEGYSISNFQVAEAVLNSKSCTLHCDGTSRDHTKIVGHQLTIDTNKSYYLGFTPVATEDADTLLDIAINCFKKLSVNYDSFTDSTSDTYKNLLAKITSTMSDRAATMKSFDKKFKEFIKSQLGEKTIIHFLYCNAHFLLGLSHSCEKALKSAESDIKQTHGRCLGRDQDKLFKSYAAVAETATNRIIRTICDVLGPRGDQKNGCRVEWITFCEKSKIPSFKGNRFNCFFEAASSIIFHFDKIMTFFTCGILNAPNLKLQSVTLDLKDNVLMTLVCCIALLYLKLTGPYWDIVTNSNIKYFEFYKYVKCMVDFLEECVKDPHQLLDVEFKSVFQDIFHSSYHQSDVYDAVHVFIHQCDESFLLNVLTKLCQESLNVSKRQLGDFLNTGYFTNLSQSDCEQLRHCSLNNLIGESSFGDLDFDISKRRHTTLHNRSATHCVRRNRTVQFLGGKSISHQSRIFSKARKLSRVLKKESVAAEQQVKLNVRTKFISNQDKKIQKEIKVIAKRSLLRDKVTKHGGPCQTSQDVDELLHRLNIKKKSQAVIREIIKNEIRYHKTVLGRRGLQFGSLDLMTTMLKSELQR